MATKTQQKVPKNQSVESVVPPSFITPEMVEANPVLEVAGLFAGDPLWKELRQEVQRIREQDQQSESQTKK